MGMHECEYCLPGEPSKFPRGSSGDTTFDFGNDGRFQVNDLVPHYIDTHGWCPPRHFVNAVVNGYERAMRGEHAPFERAQSKGIMEPAKPIRPEAIGYLTGKLEFEVYELPENFAQMVRDLLEKGRDGFWNRKQFRGMIGGQE